MQSRLVKKLIFMFSRIVKSLACLEGTVSIHAVEIAMHANMYLMSLHAFMHGIHTCMHGPWMSSHTHPCAEATSQTTWSWHQRPIHLCWYQSARSHACIDIIICRPHMLHIHSCRRKCGKFGWWWLFNWLFWVRWRQWRTHCKRGGFVHASHISGHKFDISCEVLEGRTANHECGSQSGGFLEDGGSSNCKSCFRLQSLYMCMFVCSSVAAGSSAFCTPPPLPSSILPRITWRNACIHMPWTTCALYWSNVFQGTSPKICWAQTSWQSSWSLMMTSQHKQQSWNCWKSSVSLRTCWLKGLTPWRFPRATNLRHMMVRMVWNMRAARIQEWYCRVLCPKHLQ